jgi:hypothetical protein
VGNFRVNKVLTNFLVIERFISINLGEYPSAYRMLSTHLLAGLIVIYKKMYNFNDKQKNIYVNATETFLSYQPKP